MKRFTWWAALGFFLIATMILISGCKKKSKEETVTQIKGTAFFPAGTSGDLSNAKVSLYLTLNDWYNNSPVKFAAVSGSGASASFTIPVAAGNYYLDVWKDNDNDSYWSDGDFVGWYGSGGLGSPLLTPFQLTTGSTFNVSVTMYVYATK
ncbi:MAG: hypothetical protein Q8867_10245 [Bacteroidota bacterium]|nr:hypothetical protein [Bacteroidota bacterium]